MLPIERYLSGECKFKLIFYIPSVGDESLPCEQRYKIVITN